MRIGEHARYRRLVTVELIPDRINLGDLPRLRGKVDAVTVPALRNGHRDNSYPAYFPLNPQQRSIASSLLVKRTGLEPVPSVTCRDCLPSDLWRLSSILASGLENVLVVYGDEYQDPARDRYHFKRTDQLIRQVAEACNGTRPSIGAVTNQYSNDLEREVARTLGRVDAGADFILTNISFDAEEVLAHRDRLLSAGLDVPLLTQVSIAHSLDNLRFVCEKFGIPIPDGVSRRLSSGRAEAEVELALDVYESVRHEANGVHFSYLLRKRNPIPAYCALLGAICEEPQTITVQSGSRWGPTTARG